MEQKTVLTIEQRMKATYDKSNDKILNYFAQLKKQMGPLTQHQMKLAKQMRQNNREMANLTKNTKWFKMEFLGVMFLGQAMQRFFSGLLRPAMEAVGIFEIWNTVLTVFFLPIVLQLLGAFLWLSDWLMSWPDSAKLFVGWLAIIGVILGTVLYIVGQWVLGAGSLVKAFSTVATGAKAVWAVFYAGGITLFGWITIIAAIVAAIVILYNKFQWFRNIINPILLLIMAPFRLILWAMGKLGVGWAEKAAEKMDEFEKSTLAGTGNVVDIFKDSGNEIENELTVQTAQQNMALQSGYKDMLDTTKVFSNTELNLYTDMWNAKIDVTKEAAAQIAAITAANAADINGDGHVTFNEGGSGWSDQSEAWAEYNAYAGSSGFRGRQLNDMIWRPGQAPISINPNDTLIAGMNPNGGTLGALGGKGVVINQTNHFTASNKDEISRLINDANKRMVDDVKRLVSAGG